MSGEALSTVNTQPLLADCLDWSGQSTVDISCDKSGRCGKSCERESNRRVHTYSRPKSFQFYRACVIMCDHVCMCLCLCEFTGLEMVWCPAFGNLTPAWAWRSGVRWALGDLSTGRVEPGSQHGSSILTSFVTSIVFLKFDTCAYLCILVPLVLWLLQPYRFSSVSTSPIQSLQTSPSF